MARPRKENPLTVLSVRVETSTADRVAALALETDRSQSELLRLIVSLGLDALEQPLEPEPKPKRRRMQSLQDQVLAAVARHQHERTGMAHVPALVRELRDAGNTVESVIDVLHLLGQRGRLELRPESGVGLLKPADAALCPRGMRGQPISYVRDLEYVRQLKEGYRDDDSMR